MTFLELLKRYGVPTAAHGESPHVTEGWVGADCWLCSPRSGKFKLGHNLRSGAWICWTCGRVGSPAQILAALAGISLAQALAELKGVRLPAWVPSEAPTGFLRKPAGVLDELPPVHARYLHSRGFNAKSIRAIWGVGAIANQPRLGWRLYIPIFDASGREVSWTTRAIGRGKRYHSASPGEESVHHKRLLYGEHLAGRSAVVVEGPTDAWRIGPGAVATLGVGYSRAQVLRLSRFASRTVCFDNSPEAQKRARALCAELAGFRGETTLIELSGEDPATSPAREIAEVRASFLD